MRVEYLASAIRDMVWVRHYYTAVLPAGAAKARTAIRATEDLIASNPFIGHPSDMVPEAREFPVRRTPFSFIYRVFEDRIEVLRIWDNRQDRSEIDE